MGHAASKAAQASAARKIDAEKAARRREGLRDSPLAPACLPALEVLCDYSDNLGGWVKREIPTGELVPAAKMVLRAVQNDLLQRRDRPPSAENIQFAYARHWALHALTDRMRVSEAKRVDLDVTDGRPLAVCTGADLRGWSYQASRPPILLGTPVDLKVGNGKVTTPAFGCFVIFDDSVRTSAKPWSFSCPACRARRTRHEAQVAARSISGRRVRTPTDATQV